MRPSLYDLSAVLANIPVPTVYGAFEVDGSYFLITEYVDGCSMAQLSSDDDKKAVHTELDQYLAMLKGITSKQIGGPTGIVIPPYRVMNSTDRDIWPRYSSQYKENYVFCHNDLSQENIIVDPDTLKIKAIIDWKYAGFFPSYIEAPFYKRRGPSVRLGDEPDDVSKLVRFLTTGLVE